MAANIRCIMRAKAPYGQGITKMKVKLTPTQSGTPWQSDEVNNAPYVFRSVPMGNREWNKLVGGTIGWNQLAVITATTGTVNGITRTVSGSSVTYSGNASSSTNYSCAAASPFTSGHKWYITLGNVILPSGCRLNLTSVDKRTEGIFSLSSGSFGVYITSGFDIGNFTVTPMAIDLTAYLGPTIADYVYSLEQAQAGSGIAWLKSYDLIDDQYHAYSQGSLESVNVSAHVMRDADNNIIETYPIDSSITLRGIPKKDADGNFYWDGDEYLPDGTVKRKWGEVTLTGGDGEGWSLAATYGSVTRFDSTSIYHIAKNGGACFSNLFPEGAAGTQNKELVDIHGGDGHLIVQVSSSIASTIAEWKTYLSTHNLEVIYELATETTESADPYTALQVCDPDGTEEWTDYGVEQGTRDYAVPVGHESTYAMAYPIEGVDSFVVTADDGTTHIYPVSIDVPVYKATVDVLAGEVTNYMDEIASYNGETIGEPWLSSLDVYSPGATPTTGAQVVYTMSEPEEGPATVTGDPSELSGVVSVTSTEGTVEWNELSEIGIKCVMKLKDPFQ